MIVLPAVDQHRSTVLPAVDQHRLIVLPAVDQHRLTVLPAVVQYRLIVLPAVDEHRLTVLPAVDEDRLIVRGMLLYFLAYDMDKLQEMFSTARHSMVRPLCVLQLSNRPNFFLYKQKTIHYM